MKKKIEGIIKRHPDGYGFFISDCEHPDIFIPKGAMSGVMTNDRVRAVVTGKKDNDRFYGKVSEIISRSHAVVIGKFQKTISGGIIEDGTNRWGSDVYIPTKETLSAESGNLVEAEITHYPTDRQNKIKAKVKKIISEKADDPKYDEMRVIVENKIPHTFNDKIKKEISDIKNLSFNKAKRQNLNIPFVTIDGADAKDFDDAIYINKTPNGFNILVAVADVAHYINEGSALDDEAYRRGFSTYFPNKVVPMLPESLSNNLCSLIPDEERLVLVSDMNIDFKGNVRSYKFYEALITNSNRLTYTKVQDIIEENVNEAEDLKSMLNIAKDAAKILIKKRLQEGSLNLEIEETKLVIDKQGLPVDSQKSMRLFSHRIIEEFMLLANQCVASFFIKNDLETLFRVHESPDKENLQKLEKFMFNFGFQANTKNTQKKLNSFLKKVKNTKYDQVFNIIMLRSLKQACYSPENIGHFGLNFRKYLHFTSPIRRYPDLLVHRQLKKFLSNKAQAKYDVKSFGVHLSSCERRSINAERQLYSIKKARFMKDKISQDFYGIISGVTKFGFFVLLKQYDIDGLVRLESLDGFFIFDENSMCLREKRTRKEYKIGDGVKITVLNADTVSGKIDFLLADSHNGIYKNIKANSKKHKKRKTSKANYKRFRKARISRHN